MAGSANTPKTFGKKVKHQSNDIKNLYSLTSQKRSISSTKARVWGSATSLGNPNAGNAFQTLKTAGDTMIGAIAYNPKVATVDLSGEIDIGNTTDEYTSYIMLTGQTDPDDLVTISNPTHVGQLLHIETVPELVLKHNTGNIFIPDEADRTIEAGGFATLLYDGAVHSGKWVLVSTSTGLLSSVNIWTGVNTFSSGTSFSVTSPNIYLGDASGDNIFAQGTWRFYHDVRIDNDSDGSFPVPAANFDGYFVIQDGSGNDKRVPYIDP